MLIYYKIGMKRRIHKFLNRVHTMWLFLPTRRGIRSDTGWYKKWMHSKRSGAAFNENASDNWAGACHNQLHRGLITLLKAHIMRIPSALLLIILCKFGGENFRRAASWRCSSCSFSLSSSLVLLHTRTSKGPEKSAIKKVYPVSDFDKFIYNCCTRT